MAQTKHDIQALLSQANSEPRHRFGQNFMIDGNLVRIVADAGDIEPGDCVIEVGPGTGTLTEELLSRGADVLAVEIDRDLAQLLRDRLGSKPTFRLIEGDALANKHALNTDLLAAIGDFRNRGKRVKLVANLPYNIASPLVIELLIAGVEIVAFTVQKEVAMRLKATAGSDDYGPLTVMAQLLGKVEVLRTLPPQAFWPAPKIESSLVKVTRADCLADHAMAVGTFVHQVFSYRRKTMRKALTQAGHDAERIISAVGVDPQARPETFTPEQLLAIYRASIA